MWHTLHISFLCCISSQYGYKAFDLSLWSVCYSWLYRELGTAESPNKGPTLTVKAAPYTLWRLMFGGLIVVLALDPNQWKV